MNSLIRITFLPLIFTSIFILLFSNGIKAQYQINGSASQDDCNCYTLTPTINGQVGSVWNTNQINLTNSFDFTFEVFLGCNDGGADGIAFGLQSLNTSIGVVGNGIGLAGITPSLGVFMDTYQNGIDLDPFNDHISINSNGDLNHGSVNNLAGPVDVSSTSGNVEDCAWHTLQIIWTYNSATSQTLEVYFDGVLRVTYTGNVINNVFAGAPNVFWGFTAATGGLNNEHKFCTILDAQFNLDISNSTTCPGAPINFVDSSVTFGAISNLEWNFGDGSPTISGTNDSVSHSYTNPGNYTAKLKIIDNSGCIDSIDIPITIIEPTVTATADMYLMCPGDLIQLNAAVSNITTIDYSWTPNGGNLSNDSISNPTTAPNLTTTYTVTIVDPNAPNCTASDAVSLVIDPTCDCDTDAGNIDLSPLIVCGNEVASVIHLNDSTLDANDNFTFVLHDNPGDNLGSILATSDTSNFMFPGAPLTYGTTYYISAVAGNDNLTGGIDYSDTCLNVSIGVPVTWYERPVATIVPPDTLNCLTTSVTLDGSGSSTVHGAISYNWSTNAGGNITSGNTGSAADVNFGSDYTLLITDIASGCLDSAGVTVWQDTISPNTNILPISLLTCLTTSQIIDGSGSNTASGNITYNWTTTGGNITSVTTVDTIDINTPGDYTLTITDPDNGCTRANTINVPQDTVSPPVVTNQVNICEDLLGGTLDAMFDLTALDNIMNSGLGYPINWFSDAVLSDNINSPSSITAVTQNYFAEVINLVNGCSSISVLDITVNPKPTPNFSTQPVCLGTSTIFVDNSSPTSAIASYIWDFGDGNTSTLANPIYVFSSVSPHNVSLTISDNNQCSETVTLPVIILPNPVADFEMTPDPTSTKDPVIDFLNNSTSNGGIYNWDFNGIGSSTDEFPTFTFPQDSAGLYKVTLIVTDITGCSDTLTDSLNIKGEYSIYVPNTFTPNGDGINEVFFPQGFGISDSDYLFLVFNRWGEKIFESKVIFESWDGRYMGEVVKEEVYVWKLLFVDLNGVKHELIGNVNVIR